MKHTISTEVGELAITTEGSGPTAVLWHSLFVDDRSWNLVVPDLATERSLVRITGPGHGDSAPTTARYSLDACADAAIAVLDALSMSGPIDWVGNAWGGHVGIVLAARQPSRIRTLTTFNTPVSALTKKQATAPRMLATVLQKIGPIRPLRRGVIAALLAPGSSAGLTDYVDECLRSAHRKALANAVRSISLAREDLTPMLARITAATIFVAGEHDDLWTFEQAQSAAALLPHGGAERVAASSHLTPLEQPAESVRIVRENWARGS